MEFDFSIFIGRFHPLLVHLPIGIILITILMEVLFKSKGRLIKWMWFASFISALFAIYTGWLLTQGSNYPQEALNNHKWLGFGTAGISALIWISLTVLDGKGKVFFTALRAILVFTLSFGGHIGGQLTHGTDYLVEAAPPFVKNLTGYSTPEKVDLAGLPLDSITTYRHLIQPILERKCVQCHNKTAASGNLDLSSKEGIEKGGDTGSAIMFGNLVESEVYKRVIMDPSRKKFMPTKGTPMSFKEVQLLRWWIEEDKDYKTHTSEMEMNEDVVETILDLYSADFSPKPWYEKEKAPPVEEMVLEKIRKEGYKVNVLSAEGNYLEIVNTKKTDASGLEVENIRSNVLFADFKNTELKPETFGDISLLKNLVRLQLQGSNTTSEDISKIEPLPRLESINLFGTAIDDKALEHLSKFPSLKRIYTWQTNVSEAGIKSITEVRPDIEIIGGVLD